MARKKCIISWQGFPAVPATAIAKMWAAEPEKKTVFKQRDASLEDFSSDQSETALCVYSTIFFVFDLDRLNIPGYGGNGEFDGWGNAAGQLKVRPEGIKCWDTRLGS